MFEQFPYTNFHELNLDWIIKKVQEAYSPDNPPTNVVLSVDGQTGHVQVFPNAIVRLPDVSEGTWNIHRLADGTSRGIQFTPNGAERIEGRTRYRIYDAGNPPDYPVTSVNGETGAVTILIPVQSVNGQTGTIVLYQEALIRLPDVTEGTWNIRRLADGVSRGIQFTPNGAERIEGTNRFLLYDSSNLPKTVDDRDVPIMEIAIPSDTTTWGFTRQLEDGSNTTIYLQKSGDSVKAYISYISADDQTSVTLPLLTTADIPSSSGVVSINGQAGAVTITGVDIYTDPTSNVTINQALATLTNKNTSQDQAIQNEASRASTAESNIEDAIAIISNGDTHAAIAAGQAVYVKGHNSLADGLYWATAAIATNEALSTSNLTADASGGLNTLKSDIDTLNRTIALSSQISPGFTIENSSITNAERAFFRKFGKVVVIDLAFTTGATISENNAILFSGLPRSYNGNQRFRIPNAYDPAKADLVLAVTTNGTIINQWTSGGIPAGQWSGQAVYITSD